ncbi:MAG: ATP-dependent helicase [bacterium]|nr:ATP-dependent helicase [bacterium]
MSDAPPQPLNPAQLEAVGTLDGAVLVVAGAGTGKTRVIEERTARLLERGVPPEQLLLMTFTRKAAAEMLERAAQRHPLARRVDGGTFHHVAYRIVARNFRALDLARAPTIIDGDDAANAVAAVVQRLGLQRDRKQRLPRKGALQAAFSRATNLRVPLAEVVQRDLPDFADEVATLQKVRRAWVAYKLEHGYVDYDDVLVMAAKLLEVDDVRARVAAAWRYVLVDEYQDVNAWQADIALGLAAPHGNLMVVGDPKQSIYAFRGARYEKIVGFVDDVPGARVVHLTDNYRSTQAILDVANAVMGLMESSVDRPLRAAARPRGETPALRVVEDERAVADLVADIVQERLSDPGALGGHAVLVRNSYQSVPLQGELLRRKIPFAVFGGMRFTEAAHVKDVLAALRVLHNGFDELAWLRLLQLLEGVGETTAARLFADFSDPDALAATGDSGPLARAAKRLDQAGGKARAALSDLLGAFGRAQAASTVAQAYDHVVAWYLPLLARKYPNEAYRQQDLAFFRIVVERYGDLASLLADLALDPETTRQAVNAGAPDASEGLRALTISTIHSAKGLEWDHVILVGVDDRTMPSPWAVRRAAQGGDESELEEEKRLLYVAVTRARERLGVVHALFGRQGLQRLSRFLEDPAVQATFDVSQTPRATFADERGPRLDRGGLLAALAGDDA